MSEPTALTSSQSKRGERDVAAILELLHIAAEIELAVGSRNLGSGDGRGTMVVGDFVKGGGFE